jgi:3-hydroxybutyryl-CoA dehydrogenase
VFFVSINTWGIVGTGPNGRGIAEIVASKGFEVIMIGQTQSEVDSCRRGLDNAVQTQIDRWAITEAEKRVILGRIRVSTQLEDLCAADFVLETLIADVEEHRQLMGRLDQICNKEVIIASNTSTISITELAAATGRPTQVIGCHFVAPMNKTGVVEVVRGLKTTDKTVEAVTRAVALLDRTGVAVFESTGYVTTRLIVPLINEACALLMEGVATAANIDTAMRLGFEMARGPLEIADRIGLETVQVMSERLWREFGDIRYRPSPIVRKLVRAGNLGVETGEGFFHYDGDGNRIKAGDGRV